MFLVIGFGSLLHSDDRFGPEVAEAVHAGAEPGAVEVVTPVQLTPDLAEPISRASVVYFIDASLELPPGEVRCLSLQPAQNDGLQQIAGTHHCSPELLLHWASLLYDASPPAYLYLGGAATLALGEQMSVQLGATIESTAQEILQELRIHAAIGC